MRKIEFIAPIDTLPAYAIGLIISPALAGMMDHLDQGRQVLQGGLIGHILGFSQIVVLDLLMGLFSCPRSPLVRRVK